MSFKLSIFTVEVSHVVDRWLLACFQQVGRLTCNYNVFAITIIMLGVFRYHAGIEIKQMNLNSLILHESQSVLAF